MKKKQLNNSLQLNKSTVSSFKVSSINAIKGGVSGNNHACRTNRILCVEEHTLQRDCDTVDCNNSYVGCLSAGGPGPSCPTG